MKDAKPTGRPPVLPRLEEAEKRIECLLSALESLAKRIENLERNSLSDKTPNRSYQSVFDNWGDVNGHGR